MKQRWPARARSMAAAVAAAVTAATAVATPARAVPAERFVTTTAPSTTGTLTLHARAVVAGADVRLRDVCRWSDADADVFGPVADLALVRLGDGGSSAELTADTVRSTLRDAGVNAGSVRLTGAATCVVTRDITAAAAAAAAASAEPAVAPAAFVARLTTGPAAPAPAPMTAAEAECSPFHTLRDRLTADASQRLGVAPADLQLTFAGTDASLLSLAEPEFHFELDAKRVRELGQVSWAVTVMTAGASQRATVTAEARAWQNQLVLTSAAAYHQVLRAEDLSERRVLVAQLGEEPPLTLRQAVGQQAARDLKPGAILSAKQIDPVPLARVGQYVTVTVTNGGVQVRTVARALEGGTYGQMIKVKNDATRDEYQVTLTGPQVATMGPPAADLASVRDPGQ